MRRAFVFAPIPAIFLAGASAAHFLLARAPRSIAIDRAQPMLVVTAWAKYGVEAFAILAITIALASLALGFASYATRDANAGDLDIGTLLVIALASVLACAAWPFIFSSDVYAYAAYGDLAMRGTTPYVLAPSNAHDALLDAARWQWGGAFPPCVYGPAFVAFATALVTLADFAHATATTTLWMFRATSIAAYLATIVCAHAAMRGWTAKTRTRVLAIGALNPIVVWSVAEGHNDIYALLIVAAIAASTILRDDRAFAIPAVALLVKASVGILTIALALDAVFIRGRASARIAFASLFGFALAACVVVPPLVPSLRTLARHDAYAPTVSVPAAIGFVPALAIASVCTIVALLALRAGRRSGHAWLGLAAIAALPNPYPWYGVLLVPLALAAGKSRAGISLFAVTIYAVMRYLPDTSGNMTPSVVSALSLTMLAPFVFALTGVRSDLLSPLKDSQPS